MAHALLKRSADHGRPTLPFLGDLSLTQTRVHEACGRARRSFALWVAARLKGPVIWISPEWQADQLNPDGVHEWINPARLIFVTPKRPEDMLWALEETLRSGAVPFAVADIPGLPGLTAVRRLHLAAETGATEGSFQPLGLLLTPGNGGAQGVESRWQVEPAHTDEGRCWTLLRQRARTAPQAGWRVRPGKSGLQLTPEPALTGDERSARPHP